MTLADGSTLSIVGVGTVRFRMWDDMILMVINVRYVLVYVGVLCQSVS
jgi:hypothetical protein